MFNTLFIELPQMGKTGNVTKDVEAVDPATPGVRWLQGKEIIKENVAARYVSVNNGRRAIMVHVRQALSDASNDIHPRHPVELLSVLFSAQHLRQRTPFKSCYFVEEALPISDLS
nr:hypothetical protein Iba_chr14cCG10540 [Ipomoea batatas]